MKVVIIIRIRKNSRVLGRGEIWKLNLAVVILSSHRTKLTTALRFTKLS